MHGGTKIIGNRITNCPRVSKFDASEPQRIFVLTATETKSLNPLTLTESETTRCRHMFNLESFPLTNSWQLPVALTTARHRCRIHSPIPNLIRFRTHLMGRTPNLCPSRRTGHRTHIRFPIDASIGSLNCREPAFLGGLCLSASDKAVLANAAGWRSRDGLRCRKPDNEMRSMGR